jgi:hypothetical protein
LRIVREKSQNPSQNWRLFGIVGILSIFQRAVSARPNLLIFNNQWQKLASSPAFAAENPSVFFTVLDLIHCFVKAVSKNATHCKSIRCANVM